MKKSKFSISSTQTAKGIAILILLFHHLGLNPELNLFSSDSFLYKIALQCKVCVSIFIILSGFGLNESFNKSNIKKF